jgi:hypothetical protein
MRLRLFLFLAFGCIGITSEVFYTATVDAINAALAGNAINWRLLGVSYIWMFPIYGLVAFLFPLAYKYIAKYHVALRMIIYAVAIFAVEFITGWLLDMLTGRCPWQYTSSLNICGYIRLDYFPVWAAFGYLIERIYLFLTSRFQLTNAHA